MKSVKKNMCLNIGPSLEGSRTCGAGIDLTYKALIQLSNQSRSFDKKNKWNIDICLLGLL